MGTYTTRLGCQLSFSEEKEADIIAIIQKLNATHKTGQFISNLIRIALECPEVIDKGSEDYAPGALMRSMDACGISYDRRQFFQSVSKEISDMKQKIDSIYELAFKTYSLGLMGKHLGIEEKSDNNLMSTFILERQLKDIQTTLGVNIADSVYASNKVADVHEKAEEVMEYAIESYSGIINELISKLTVKPIEVPVQTAVQPINVAQQAVMAQPVTQVQPAAPVQPTPQTVVQPAVQDSQKQEDEVVDFGNEQPIEFGTDASDLAALEAFMGLS